MGTSEFNYIQAIKNSLGSLVNFHVIKETEKEICISTNSLFMGGFINNYSIVADNNGVFELLFYPAGAVPKEYIPQFCVQCARAANNIQKVKMYLDNENCVIIAFDTLLPADEELILGEIKTAFSLMAFTCGEMLPEIMPGYWNAVKKYGLD